MTHVSLLIARIGLGTVFVAHGWQKLNGMGPADVTVYYRKVGVPWPEIATYVATYVELIAGVALVIGACTAIAGLLLTADMLGALFVVHMQHGMFINDNGFELVLVLAMGTFMLAVLGAGRYSVDEYLYPRIGRAAALDGIN